jgi:hypothetical protein
LDRLDAPRLAALWLGTLAAAAGVAASITAVYLGMRDLMVESGGVCASGGPYEIANECSSGQMALLFGGIVAMLLFTGLHAAVTHLAHGPRIGWPAISGVLFLALGWNFIDLGLDPPQEEGTSVGWLVSGVVFWLMAVGFLAPAAMRAKEWLSRGGEPEPPLFRAATVQAAGEGAVRAGGSPAGAARGGRAADPAADPAAGPVRPDAPVRADVPVRLVLPPRGPDDPGAA